MYRWSAGSIDGSGGSAGPERHTYYVINPCRGGRRGAGRARVARSPPPPAWAAAGRAVLAGFPRPRASRPLTTHGAPRSAAASRTATRVDFAPPCIALCRNRPVMSFMLISARWIFLQSDRSVKVAHHRECQKLLDVTPVYFSVRIREFYTSSRWGTSAPSLEWDFRPARAAVTRGLRCCARDRLATVPRNVRICWVDSAVRVLRARSAFLFAWRIRVDFIFVWGAMCALDARVCGPARVCVHRDGRLLPAGRFI